MTAALVADPRQALELEADAASAENPCQTKEFDGTLNLPTNLLNSAEEHKSCRVTAVQVTRGPPAARQHRAQFQPGLGLNLFL